MRMARAGIEPATLPLQMAAGIGLLVGSVGQAQEDLRRRGVRQGITETSQRLLMDRRLHATRANAFDARPGGADRRQN